MVSPTFVALDFETADHGRDSACSVGLVRVEANQIVETAYYLIRPPRAEFRFTHIHGIRWWDVAEELTFGERWPDMLPILRDADFLAAHNASFDRSVLYTCCDAYGLTRPPHPFVCTVQLARRTWNLPRHGLSHVAQHLGIELNHHHALADATACALIVIAANQLREQDRFVV